MSRSGMLPGRIVFWLLRILLAVVFVYAGVAKVVDPQAFSESIASFRLLPAILVNPVALTLPPLEILTGVLLPFGGRLQRVGAFCQFALLFLFLVALASAQARGLNVDCGCFGANKFDALSPTKNLWITMARDVALGAAALFLYVKSRSDESPGQATAVAGRSGGGRDASPTGP